MLTFVAEMYVDLVFDRPAQQIVNAGRKQKRCEVLLLKWERLSGGRWDELTTHIRIPTLARLNECLHTHISRGIRFLYHFHPSYTSVPDPWGTGYCLLVPFRTSPWRFSWRWPMSVRTRGWHRHSGSPMQLGWFLRSLWRKNLRIDIQRLRYQAGGC